MLAQGLKSAFHADLTTDLSSSFYLHGILCCSYSAMLMKFVNSETKCAAEITNNEPDASLHFNLTISLTKHCLTTININNVAVLILTSGRWDSRCTSCGS